MYLKLGYRWKMGYPKKNLPQRKMGYGTQWDIPYPIPATTPECVKFNHVWIWVFLERFRPNRVSNFIRVEAKPSDLSLDNIAMFASHESYSFRAKKVRYAMWSNTFCAIATQSRAVGISIIRNLCVAAAGAAMAVGWLETEKNVSHGRYRGHGWHFFFQCPAKTQKPTKNARKCCKMVGKRPLADHGRGWLGVLLDSVFP